MVLTSKARLSSETAASWSNYINLGGLQDLDGVEFVTAAVRSITPIGVLEANLPASADIIKIEIDVLNQDGYDAGQRGPSRTVGYLEYHDLVYGTASVFAQGNSLYGKFTVNKTQCNAAQWRVRASWVSSASSVQPVSDWEVALELAY